MNYLFDLYGWYAGESDAATDRSTTVAPTDVTIHYAEGVPRSNWTGYAWLMLPYTTPPIAKPVIIVPQVVTMRQARLALFNAGLLDCVESVVANAGRAAQIEWEYSQEIQRSAALVYEISRILELDGSQVDALFVNAAVI